MSTVRIENTDIQICLDYVVQTNDSVISINSYNYRKP